MWRERVRSGASGTSRGCSRWRRWRSRSWRLQHTGSPRHRRTRTQACVDTRIDARIDARFDARIGTRGRSDASAHEHTQSVPARSHLGGAMLLR